MAVLLLGWGFCGWHCFCQWVSKQMPFSCNCVSCMESTLAPIVLFGAHRFIVGCVYAHWSYASFPALLALPHPFPVSFCSTLVSAVPPSVAVLDFLLTVIQYPAVAAVIFCGKGMSMFIFSAINLTPPPRIDGNVFVSPPPSPPPLSSTCKYPLLGPQHSISHVCVCGGGGRDYCN